MRKYFIVSQWWDRVMGWWLWLRRRQRCARTPFEPAPVQSIQAQPAARQNQ